MRHQILHSDACNTRMMSEDVKIQSYTNAFNVVFCKCICFICLALNVAQTYLAEYLQVHNLCCSFAACHVYLYLSFKAKKLIKWSIVRYSW